MIPAEVRRQIVNEAKTWLGTPWRHGARLKNAGVDCAMLIREVLVACNLVPAFPVKEYVEQWALHRSDEQFLATLQRFGRKTGEALPGNVIVIKYGRCYSHGGIIIDWPIIIHAFKRERAVVYGDVEASGLIRRPHKLYEVSPWVG